MLSWYQKQTPEKRKEWARAQYLKHKEKRLANARDWHKNNPEKTKKAYKEFMERNPGIQSEYYRRWKEKDPERAIIAGRKSAIAYHYRHHEKQKEKLRENAKKRWLEKPNEMKEYKRINSLKLRIEKAGREPSETCECCGVQARIVFDHDHVTGEFRGWICDKCNMALGMVNDSPETLLKLVEYLYKNHPPLKNLFTDSQGDFLGRSK